MFLIGLWLFSVPAVRFLFLSTRLLRLISSEKRRFPEIFQDDQEARHYTPIAGAVHGSVDGVPGFLGSGKVTTAQRGYTTRGGG